MPNSNADWRVVETIVERKELPLRLLVDVLHQGSGNMLYVREIVVSEVVSTAPLPVVASTKLVGTKLYDLDFSDVKLFQETLMNRSFANRPTLPLGITLDCSNPISVTEFRGEVVKGSFAIGSTNLNETLSSQIAFVLDKAGEVPLVPGKTYRIRVTYLTRNDSAGRMVIANDDPTPLASVELPGTANEWKTLDLTFKQPAGSTRLAVENRTVGEGNTLFIRGFEVLAID